MADKYLLENGTDRYLLEDGTSLLLLEPPQIEVDASTPALVAASNDPWTTATFDPPPNSLLVIGIMGDWFGGTPTITLTDSLSQLSFTQQVSNGAVNQGLARIYTSEVGANDGARTISATTSLTSDVGGIKVWVVNNYRTAGFVDNTSGGTNVTTDPLNASHTVNNDRCLVFAVAVDWNSNGVPTTTDVGEGFDDADLSLIALRKSAIVTPAGSVTVNFNAPATPPLWTYSIISIREQDAATGISGSVGTVTETDTAQPIAKSKVKSIGIVPETDIAMPVGRAHTRAIGMVVETDTARTLGITKGINTVVETDSALHIGRPVFKAISPVVETDAAIAVARRKTKAVGTVSETDVAIAISRRKTRTLGIVSETDAAGTFGKKKVKAIGIVPEIDLALTIVKPLKGANTVTETDTAMPIGKRKRKSIGIVTETDLAIALTRTHRRTIGIVTETDLAIALSRRKTKVVGIVVETDTARPLGKKKVRLVGTVVEIDLALPITVPPTVLTAIHVEIGLTGVVPRDLDGPSLQRIITGAGVQGIEGVGTIPVLIGDVASHALVVDGPSLSRLITGAGIKDVKGAGI